MGSKEDVAAKIDKNAQILIQDLQIEVENNKEQVGGILSCKYKLFDIFPGFGGITRVGNRRKTGST